MPTVKVSELDQIMTLANTDLLLVSQDQGGSVFVSKAVPYPALIGSSKIESNFFDNPDFSISQFYGASPSVQIYSAMPADNGHPIDRWRVSTPGSGTWTVTRVTSDAPISSVSKYTLRLSNTTANNTITLSQRWTSDQVRSIRTGPCTISFWVRPETGITSVIINFKVPTADTNFTSTYIRNESGSGKTITGLTANSWNLVTYTFDPSLWTTDGNNSSIVNGLQFDLVLAAAASYWGVADFQFNRGTVANTFVNPSLYVNEYRCFPFFQKTFKRDTPVAQNSGEYTSAFAARAYTTVGNNLRFQWWYQMNMRITNPTVTTYCYNASSSNFTVGASTAVTASIPYITESSCTVDGGGSQTVELGDAVTIHITVDARL